MSSNEKNQGRERTEPTLGDLGQIDSTARRRTPAEPVHAPATAADVAYAAAAHQAGRGSERRGWLWPLAALVLIALLALAWINQDRLRDLLPRTQLNGMLERADQALAAGHLDGRDGTSARELYATANALEPDNEHARTGLHRVGTAELARASSAIGAGHFDAAQADIASARELLGGGAAVDAAQQALDHARNAQPQNHTDVLTERAQAALAAGRLDGADGAAALYRRALASDADNAVARHGLDKVGDALAARARADLQHNDLPAASSVIAHIGTVVPNDGDLPALRASLAQAQQQAQSAIKDHLDKGQAYLRSGHFGGDGDDNALAQFRAVLAVDPDNAQARAGVDQVAQALILRANAAIDGKDFSQAATLLDAATKLAPDAAGLAAAEARLQEKPEAGDASAASPPSTLSAAQQSHVQTLLQQARAATRAGDIMLPPGASAYDLYRAALAIDANNTAARAGLKSLPARTTELFEQALGAGQLRHAEDLLGTLGDLSPDDPASGHLSDRLADAWLDRAEQAIDHGNRAGARQALNAAQRLSPASTRLNQLDARLRGG